MRLQDIVIGETYRLESSPNYSYVKVIEILKKGTSEISKNKTLLKYEHIVEKNDTWGLIKYFKPSSLIKLER